MKKKLVVYDGSQDYRKIRELKNSKIKSEISSDLTTPFNSPGHTEKKANSILTVLLGISFILTGIIMFIFRI